MKKIFFYITVICFAIPLCLTLYGCSWFRNLTEYELDEHSFGADKIAGIENALGIDLPAGAKGLKYHYIPPIDPIVFAKIEIPANAEKLMKTQIAAFDRNYNFPSDFANDRCRWWPWPSNTENAIVSRKVFYKDFYIDIYLLWEKERLILYIKYFTV